MTFAADRAIRIITGESPNSVERLAVADLQTCLSDMTGQPVAVQVYRDLRSQDHAAAGLTFLVGTPDSNQAVAQLVARRELTVPEDLGEQGGCIRSLCHGKEDVIALCGHEPVGATHAVYHYLERVCGVGFFSAGGRIPRRSLPVTLGLDETIRPHFGIRGYMTHPIWTRPYPHCCRLWSFDEWKREIDWMRRKRLNLLVLFHDEGTYLWGDAIFRAFPEIEKNERSLEKFVVDPEYRTELNQRIVRYARESGISIAYNLMYSQVPDFFQDAHPELTYHQLQMENAGICASQPECREIMKRFWEKILETCGVDDSHIYIVCPYQHEVARCEHFPTSAPVAVQACEVLKELDPQARVFIESWCWGRYWLERDKPREWREFLDQTPPEIGVAELDREFALDPEHEELFGWFAPREWLAMRLLTFETNYPPSFLETTPASLAADYRTAADHRASGIIAFNIIANSNDLLCDMAGELAWNPRRSEIECREDYARRRYGPDAAPSMAESLKLQVEAADIALRLAAGEKCLAAESELYLKVMEWEAAARERRTPGGQHVDGRDCQAGENRRERSGSEDEAAVSRGATDSEDAPRGGGGVVVAIDRKVEAARTADDGEELNAWIADRLDLFRRKHACAVEALRLARAASSAVGAVDAAATSGASEEARARVTAGASAAESAIVLAMSGASEEVEAHTVSEVTSASATAGTPVEGARGGCGSSVLWANDLWELDYSVARWEGCIAFYEACARRAAPELAALHLEAALLSFQKVKSILAQRSDYSMANLTQLGGDVAYLPHFLDGWDTISRRWVDIRPYYYVVWEHVDRYEEKLREMAAALGLSAAASP